MPQLVKRTEIIAYLNTGEKGAKIGRASCRERLEISVVAVSLKKRERAEN